MKEPIHQAWSTRTALPALGFQRKIFGYEYGSAQKLRQAGLNVRLTRPTAPPVKQNATIAGEHYYNLMMDRKSLFHCALLGKYPVPAPLLAAVWPVPAAALGLQWARARACVTRHLLASGSTLFNAVAELGCAGAPEVMDTSVSLGVQPRRLPGYNVLPAALVQKRQTWSWMSGIRATE
ncbi:hypothetical protein VTK26DRAFT_8507 [Humicola hyalothermophila]